MLRRGGPDGDRRNARITYWVVLGTLTLIIETARKNSPAADPQRELWLVSPELRGRASVSMRSRRVIGPGREIDKSAWPEYYIHIYIHICRRPHEKNQHHDR